MFTLMIFPNTTGSRLERLKMLTIQQHAEQFGSRATAHILLNQRLRKFGFFIDELPDTSEVADLLDELQSAVDCQDKELIKDLLSVVSFDWVGELILS